MVPSDGRRDEPKWRGTRKLGDLVRSVLKQYRVGPRGGNKGSGLRRVQQAWAEAAGSEIAEHTRLASCDRGVLVIEVDSAPLLHELAVYMKRDLLAVLCKKADVPVTDLKFRPGVSEKSRGAS